jgi:hypothetical protein
MIRFTRFAVALALVSSACAEPSEPPQVELTTERLAPNEVKNWSRPAVESGHPEITVQRVFSAAEPCQVLNADVIERARREYVLRVFARKAPQTCGDRSHDIGYRAVLKGVPAGRGNLRVVHIVTNGARTTRRVLEHPIVVTDGSADAMSDRTSRRRGVALPHP